MKIAESSVHLSSIHTSSTSSETRESLKIWQDGAPSRETAIPQEESVRSATDRQEASQVSLSEFARQQRVSVESLESGFDDEDEALTDLNLRILKSLFEKLTGREIKVHTPKIGKELTGTVPEQPVSSEGDEARSGWGLEYQKTETYHEEEFVAFNAQGVVKTADGREVALDLSFALKRSFTSTFSTELRAGDALKDPLVVNFSGTAAQLTDQKFSFDLDADGSMDHISFVTPGSGFLALDKDGSGGIEDGNELFGTQSGDGFADLSRYDQDENGWIDENDAVFSELRIWSKTVAGEDQLVRLADQGIGALYLGRVDTAFSLKDEGNTLQGQMRSSGLFLRENGTSGTLAQLDLVV